jgi:hypothetical protein
MIQTTQNNTRVNIFNRVVPHTLSSVYHQNHPHNAQKKTLSPISQILIIDFSFKLSQQKQNIRVFVFSDQASKRK